MILSDEEKSRSREILIKKSMEVIEDSRLDNGAIVAANATKEYYPPTAKNYFYVWPRDASYACIAADFLGIGNMQENFFKWCYTRAESFKETGLLYEKYHVNGLKALDRFQPDQTAILLYAIWHHYIQYKNKEQCNNFDINELITKSANGLCRKWDKNHFNIVTNDLWEERMTFPDLNENFTYSLAACIKGLECAYSMIGNDTWIKVLNQMKEQLDKHYIKTDKINEDRLDACNEWVNRNSNGFFVRSYGKLIDKSIDASVLGLVYPFEIYKPNDPRIISTIEEIELKLIKNGGVHRYEFDEYDGWMYGQMHRKKGAGAWPLLNFWLSIYYCKSGNKSKAKMYYEWILSNVTDYIPEQIFDNEIQVSICPLLWSHSMFIIASRFLGYL